MTTIAKKICCKCACWKAFERDIACFRSAVASHLVIGEINKRISKLTVTYQFLQLPQWKEAHPWNAYRDCACHLQRAQRQMRSAYQGAHEMQNDADVNTTADEEVAAGDSETKINEYTRSRTKPSKTRQRTRPHQKPTHSSQAITLRWLDRKTTTTQVIPLVFTYWSNEWVNVCLFSPCFIHSLTDDTMF